MPISSSATELPSGPWLQLDVPPRRRQLRHRADRLPPRYRLRTGVPVPPRPAHGATIRPAATPGTAGRSSRRWAVGPSPPDEAGGGTPSTRHSSSVSTRAVAPQTVSPATGRTRRGTHRRARRRPAAAGHGPELLGEYTVAPPARQGHVEHPGHLVRAGRRRGRGSRMATTGVIRVLDETVGMAVRWPTTVTRAGSRPTSSCASRRAPSSIPSPGSSLPPGKATPFAAISPRKALGTAH